MIPNPAQASAASDEQILAMMDSQLAALRTRLQVGEEIVTICGRGVNILRNSPEPTLANIGQVVGALGQAIECILESNLMANRQSIAELSQQLEQIETARKQRASKVHLGGFVPRLR